jgi:hypothetical protein
MQAREVGQIGMYTQNINQSMNQGALLLQSNIFCNKGNNTELWVSTSGGPKNFLKKAKSDFSILSSLQNSGQGESWKYEGKNQKLVF